MINAGLENASFESSATGWRANNLSDMVSYTQYTDPLRAHDGSGFLEMNTRASSGSIAQDAPITPWNSFQTFSFSVWIRAAPGTNAVSGAVALSVVELGVVKEVAWTGFTVGQNWTQVTVPLYLDNISHNSTLRSEVYMNTVGVNFDVDGAYWAYTAAPF